MDFETLAVAQEYTDSQRLAYTETIKTVSSVTLTSTNNLMDFVPMSGRPISLVAGRTYTVSVASDDPNAILYFPTIDCVCVDMSGGAGMAFAIGNQVLFDAQESEDTGEWFMILEAFQDGEWMSVALWGIPSISATDSITVNVTSSTETVHTIDPMYMPVIKIKTVYDPTATNVILSDEEAVQLDVFASLGMGAFLVCENPEAPWSCPLIYFPEVGHPVFHASLFGETLMIGKYEGKWVWNPQ